MRVDSRLFPLSLMVKPLLLTGFLLVATCCFAAEKTPLPIKIATPEWPGQTQQDGSGLFFDLLKRVYEPEGIGVVWEFASWRRAKEMVRTGQVDAMLSVWQEAADTAGFLIPEKPLYVEETVAVFKRRTIPDWKGISSLKGKTAVWITGYGYEESPELISSPMIWTSVDTSADGWRILGADRAMVLLDARIDVDWYVREHLVDPAVFRVESLWSEKAYVAFTNRSRSRDLIAIYERRISEMLASGRLENLHRKWQVPFDGAIWRP